jgi:hypothetical protein
MSDLVDCSRPCTASVVGRGVRRQSLRCGASLAPTMARVDALLEHAKTATALDPFRCRHGAGCGLDGACRRLNGACCGPAHDSVFRSFPPSSRARDGGADGAERGCSAILDTRHTVTAARHWLGVAIRHVPCLGWRARHGSLVLGLVHM